MGRDGKAMAKHWLTPPPRTQPERPILKQNSFGGKALRSISIERGVARKEVWHNINTNRFRHRGTLQMMGQARLASKALMPTSKCNSDRVAGSDSTSRVTLRPTIVPSSSKLKLLRLAGIMPIKHSQKSTEFRPRSSIISDKLCCLRKVLAMASPACSVIRHAQSANCKTPKPAGKASMRTQMSSSQMLLRKSSPLWSSSATSG